MKPTTTAESGARRITRNARPRRRWAVAAATIVVGAGLVVAGPASLAFAQSPEPNVHFVDYYPTVHDTRPTGVVVEGLGSIRCSEYSLSSIERATVSYVRDRKPVWTEFSVQHGCGSIKQYESAIHSLIRYVESRASGARSWWGGIMLDEEPAWGYGPSPLTSLNKYALHQTVNTPGITYVSTEDTDYSGYWSQRQYDDIVAGTITAPQVYTSFMLNIVNRSDELSNLVTWWRGAPYPFDSESYTLRHVKGSPWKESFGTSKRWYWSNQYQN